MTTAALPYALVAGTNENVNNVQADLEYLRDLINGGLDQDNLSSTGRTNLLPWTIDIDPFTTAATTTGTWTTTVDTSQIKNGFLVSDGTQSDVIGWDVTLAAGTWTFSLLHSKSSNRPVYTVALDGSSAGTIDGYNASLTYNNLSTITGITVSTTGKKRLTLTLGTKNASSSSYVGAITGVRLLRTA